GIAFDAQGSMYVSESGTAGHGDAGLTRTGRVTKYVHGSAVWSTLFESFFASEDPSQPPDVLGPEGISALGNCTNARDRGHDACQIRLIMSESRAGIAAESNGALNATQAGLLFALDGASGRATAVSDVGDQMYKWTGDRKSLFPDDFPDSNPYGVLVTVDRITGKVRTFVADAGANTISEVMHDGTLRVIAYIPNETGPPFRDATPTCIAQGPDGMLYVATLNFVANLFVFGSGRSNVWRVDPNANYPTVPTLWARGLTTPTSCTFDRAGNFWAAEMFQPNHGGPPGDVVRIPFARPDQLARFGGGMLPLAGAIAQGPDGAMYVAINSSSSVPGSGAVVRLTTSG
ncbi:MAG TPA: ScyD/ScyE family protein, partial [Gaiellaceae bacterium]|nr:ScyD/ScyE family protein [Gaiellaceae bacterium]